MPAHGDHAGMHGCKIVPVLSANVLVYLILKCMRSVRMYPVLRGGGEGSASQKRPHGRKQIMDRSLRDEGMGYHIKEPASVWNILVNFILEFAKMYEILIIYHRIS